VVAEAVGGRRKERRRGRQGSFGARMASGSGGRPDDLGGGSPGERAKKEEGSHSSVARGTRLHGTERSLKGFTGPSAPTSTRKETPDSPPG
jgi:hypothetical protein